MRAAAGGKARYNMNPIRVFIADDHEVFREGLRLLINNQQDMMVAGEADNGITAVEDIKSIRPDVSLLDISMPGMTGIDALRIIRQHDDAHRAVMLSMHSKESCIFESLESGAQGFVVKASGSREVCESIRKVYSGQYFLCSHINSDIMEKYISHYKNNTGRSTYDVLSERELQVVRLVAEGHSAQQAADILCISPKTIERHRANVMKKLDIHTTAGLIKYAVTNGIIDPDVW